MLREDGDPSRRFDYLFEPLDDLDDDDTVDDRPRAVDQSDGDIRSSGGAPSRIAFAAVVVATMAAVAAIVVLLLQRPEPADQFDAPISTVPPSTTAPSVPTQPAPIPPPEVTTSNVPTLDAPATIAPEPQPQPQPTTSGSEPEVGVTRSPTVRAPISVEPEPRPPFPNEDGGQHGGLLGGLPGPL